MSTNRSRIGVKAKAQPGLVFTSLYHHIADIDNLRESYHALDADKATEIDDVTKSMYAEGLEANLEDLSARLRRMGYRPQPKRRSYIPKPGSEKGRPLGISSFEDKIVELTTKSVLDPFSSRCSKTVATVTLKTHWVLVVMGQFTRRIIGFGVQVGDVDGVALCRMFNKAIARMGVPKYLSSDNDPLFTYHRWLANLRILEIDEVKTVPYTPISYPFVERLIGTIRRECLDQVFFWNTVDLERKLESFQLYFNNSRTHASLDGKTPAEIGGDVVTHRATLRNFTWEKHCGGLYELPVAA